MSATPTLDLLEGAILAADAAGRPGTRLVLAPDVHDRALAEARWLASQPDRPAFVLLRAPVERDRTAPKGAVWVLER